MHRYASKRAPEAGATISPTKSNSAGREGKIRKTENQQTIHENRISLKKQQDDAVAVEVSPKKSTKTGNPPKDAETQVERNVSAEEIIPRSRAEADILSGLNQSSRHRQLPCRTFISTGTCPYKDRCVYLHDPRLAYSGQVSTVCLPFLKGI